MSGAFGVGCPDVYEDGVLITEAAAILDFMDEQVANPGGSASDTAQIFQRIPSLCQGRLSLSSTDAVTTADQTAKTTLYWHFWQGSQTSIYQNNPGGLYDTFWWKYENDAVRSFNLTETQSCNTTNTSDEITVADGYVLLPGMEVTGTGIPASTSIASVTGNIATLDQAATADGTGVSLTFKLPAGKNFDVFLREAGSPNNAYLMLAPAWTNDTTRDFEVSLQDGVLVNDAQITGTVNGTAKTWRYVGTIRTTATAGQTEDSEANRFVWNAYNRVFRSLKAVDATNSWTYSTASFRQANASTANQLNFVIGQDWGPILAMVHVVTSSSAVLTIAAGIGLDSTTVDGGSLKGSSSVTTATGRLQTSAHLHVHPGIGYHYLAWLERGAGSGTQTWYGDNNLTYWQSGIMGGGFF